MKNLQSVAGLGGILILAIALSPTAADGSRIFLQLGNLTDILRQISVIGIIALAMTFVILTAGIDLSVGSILALSTSVVAMTLTRVGARLGYTQHILIAILATLAISTAVGALNGAVVALLGIQPFVVTLASMIGIRGLAKWMTGNANIDIGFGQDVAAAFADLFRRKGVVIGSYMALSATFWVVLGRTVFGRHVRAITPRKVIDQIRFAPDAPIDPYVTVGNFLMPNTTILRHSDHYESLTFVPHPTDPNRSRIDVRLVVPPVTSDEERALWEKNWDILVKTVIMEDLPLNRSLQRALSEARDRDRCG